MEAVLVPLVHVAKVLVHPPIVKVTSIGMVKVNIAGRWSQGAWPNMKHVISTIGTSVSEPHTVRQKYSGRK